MRYLFLGIVFLLSSCGINHDVEHKVTFDGEAETRHVIVIDQTFCDDYGISKSEKKECLDKLLEVISKCENMIKLEEE